MVRTMLLYSKASTVTGRALSAALGIPGRRVPKSDDLVSIRWGSSAECPEVTNVINKREAVANTSNSKTMLTMLHTAGVPSPEIVVGDVDFRVFLRRINHIGGRDIVSVDGGNIEGLLEEKNRSYAVRFIPAKYEYRIHVILGDVVRKFLKVGGENSDIKSSYFGWEYQLLERTTINVACELSIKAVAALGLDFGGVDVIKTLDERYIVLEVNSAPALNTNTLAVYAERLGKCLLDRKTS